MKKFLETLTAWEGAVRGDAVHKRIVDAYNSYLPHPRSHKLTYTDDYCAATVSAAAILCGLTEVLPVECSCGEQMRWYQSRGQWIEDDAHVPQIGEQVFYCWNDRKDYALTDCTGAPNHTGIVTACDGKTFTVFEGNKGSLPHYPRERAVYSRLRHTCISCGKAHVGARRQGRGSQKDAGISQCLWVCAGR